MGKITIIPTEYEEQCMLVQYLEMRGLKFSKIAQETFTRDWGVKMKNKLSGLRRGVPDMIIIIPIKESNGSENKLLFLEMKRLKGGNVKEDQLEWIIELNKIKGVHAKVAHGCGEAIEIIENYENNSAATSKGGNKS